MKKKNLPKWSRIKDYISRGKEPNKILHFMEIDENLWICIHTDINVYDFKNKIMWKGDLV